MKSQKLIHVKGYKRKRFGKIESVSSYNRRYPQISIRQPLKMKKRYKTPTMKKNLPHNIMKGMKEIAKDNYEHSIALDFERIMNQPQRIAIVKGSEVETLKIEDFEIFGHTHPGHRTPTPSVGDLRNMKPLEPEFIIAGKTGKIFIYNIEDPIQYQRWIKRTRNRKSAESVIQNEDMRLLSRRKKYYNKAKITKSAINTIRINDVAYYDWHETEKGREMFFNITGIKVYPYKKSTKVELRDDPHLEKRMPSIPETYMKKWHSTKK